MSKLGALTTLVFLIFPFFGGVEAQQLDTNPLKIDRKKVGKGVNFYSHQKESEIGAAFAKTVEQQVSILDDPVVSEYVNRIAQRLMLASATDASLTVKVIDREEPNAFALPGGFAYITSGLLLKTANEAELASVLAHWAAHVVARHGTRAATRAEVVGKATFQFRKPIDVNNETVPLVLVDFDADAFEKEANRLKLDYVMQCGYNPEAFADLSGRLSAYTSASKTSTTTKNLHTVLLIGHLLSAESLRTELQNVKVVRAGRASFTNNSPEFQSMKARVRAVAVK